MRLGKFTPGPWRTDDLLRAVEGRCFTGEYKQICAPIRGGNVEETNANARLIAAAPEMFEALAGLLDTPEVRAAETDTVSADLYDWARIAREVIAKARGEGTQAQ